MTTYPTTGFTAEVKTPDNNATADEIISENNDSYYDAVKLDPFFESLFNYIQTPAFIGSAAVVSVVLLLVTMVIYSCRK